MAEARPPYIVVIGGGKVGYYLTKHLLEAGYEVALVEKDRARASALGSHLGRCAILVGDGDEMAFLGTTGIERASVVAAVTGDDEDNLIACQLARRTFAVPRTLARVNNPRNVRLFHQLGVDVAVSATDVILGVIDSELAQGGDVRGLPLEGTEASLVRITVPVGLLVGHRTDEVAALRGERILLVVRGGEPVDPITPLQAGDQVVVYTRRPAADLILTELLPAAAGA
ncbi:MAG TPA: TrkA family potassium uptake protein [Verrucomicrobiae bacterium]|nr:TrkA family potassium uptake protein [Verrucomicrobiae bacterium]